MTFDLADHLGLMARAVRDLERDGQAVKGVQASRVYPTDSGDLWNAITDPDRLARWFAPVAGDLRLGGRYQVEGNASGTIAECDPERHLSVTWEFGGAVSWVTVILTEVSGGTRLELEHVAPVDEHWTQFGPGAAGVGWDLGFLGLARHVDAPAAPAPPEADPAWMASAEAHDFVRSSSDGWGEAAIAAGEPDEDARAAAEATRRFYTGQAPSEEA